MAFSHICACHLSVFPLPAQSPCSNAGGEVGRSHDFLGISYPGAHADDLANVLWSQSALTHLSLGETRLTDFALSSFSGTSLQQLDVRETQVRNALSY